MKNVTVSLPDEVYRLARIKAAERDTSVSALVREFLMSLGEDDTDFARRKKLQNETIASIRRFSAADRLRRDKVHERGPVRSEDLNHGHDFGGMRVEDPFRRS